MTPGDRLEELSRLAATMARESEGEILAASRVVVETIKAGGIVFTCGNGGSMAQAQHLAAELTGRYRRDRRPFAAHALGSNPAHMTCAANDYGYRLTFARDLEAFASCDDLSRDCLVILSTSGKSPSVLEAERVAAGVGMPIVAILGHMPKHARDTWEITSHVVMTPEADTGHTQELHAAVLHCICEAVEEAIE